MCVRQGAVGSGRCALPSGFSKFNPLFAMVSATGGITGGDDGLERPGLTSRIIA
jgi:hypothetical protein